MSFLVHIDPLLKLLFIFGLRPFIFRKQTNRVQSKCFSKLYILAFFFVISFFVAFFAYSGYFAEHVELEQRLADTYNICELLQVILNVKIYYVTIFAGLVYGRNHVRLLNALSDVDLKLRSEESASNNQRIPFESFRHIFLIVILYYLLCISGIYV